MKLSEKKELARKKREIENELDYLNDEIRQCYPPKRESLQREINQLEKKLKRVRGRMEAELDRKYS